MIIGKQQQDHHRKSLVNWMLLYLSGKPFLQQFQKFRESLPDSLSRFRTAPLDDRIVAQLTHIKLVKPEFLWSFFTDILLVQEYQQLYLSSD